MKRALIIGCGYTGAALAGRLASAGVEVTGTNATARSLPGVAIRRLDLLTTGDELSLREAAHAVVYYMVPTLCRVYDGRSHLTPMARVLSALAAQPIQGLIYLSSTSVYGDRQGEWVDEQTPLSPGSPWGRMRMDLERQVWSLGQQQRVPACVVRLPEIYGPGRGPVARLRRGYTLSFPDRYSNRIHIDDLVDVLVRLGRDLDQPLLLASDSCPATSREVYTHAARLMGIDLVVEAGRAGGDLNRVSLMRDSKRCRNARLLEWLGSPLRYPSYREGIRAILSVEPAGG